MRVKREHSLFLASWVIDSNSPERILEKARDLRRMMKNRPGDFPLQVSGPYSIRGESRGIQVLEADYVKLDNLMNFWLPEIVLTFEPITQTRLWEIEGSQPKTAKGRQSNQAIPVRG